MPALSIPILSVAVAESDNSGRAGSEFSPTLFFQHAGALGNVLPGQIILRTRHVPTAKDRGFLPLSMSYAERVTHAD
jgi:hypothetical protein